MTKDEFFDRCDQASIEFAPAGLRLNKYTSDYYDIHYKLWIVGEHSLDPTLCMAVDCFPVGKYYSQGKAQKEHNKYLRWFEEWRG